MAKLRAELDSGGLGVHEGFDMSDTESDFGMYDDAEAVGEFVKPPPKKNDAGPLEAVPTYQVGSGIVLQDTSPVAGEGSILAPKVGSKDVEKVINRPGDMHENAIAAGPKGESPDPNHEDGEISDDDGDMPMDIASNASSQSDNEGGDGREVDIEDAKAKLLARVEAAAAEDERLTAKEEHELRLRMNMRATVTMILTVAGEAYGQRDLLEFRDPFVGI